MKGPAEFAAALEAAESRALAAEKERDALRERGRAGDAVWRCRCGHVNTDHDQELREGNVLSWGCNQDCDCERFSIADVTEEPVTPISALRAAEAREQKLREALTAAQEMHDALWEQFSHHTLAGRTWQAFIAFEKAAKAALSDTNPETEKGGGRPRMSEGGTPVATDTSFDCAECGQRVGTEFHSYESCLLYKNALGRLNDLERQYVFGAGLKAMRDRVQAKKLPGEAGEETP